MTIFEYLDYKKYILDQAKSLGRPWGYWAKLSQCIGCQPAYLSKCLKDKTHLTIDQILGVAKFNQLSKLETDYLISMAEFARSNSKSNQQYFREKLKEIKLQFETQINRSGKRGIERSEDQELYYSDWLWMAIHFATSIDSLQTQSALTERFNISSAQVLFILEKLQDFGLVIKKGDRWIFHSGQVQITKKSPLNSPHLKNFRMRAIIDSQNPSSDGVHYSSIYAISKKDFGIIKQEVEKLIQSSIAQVTLSNEEELACMNLDFFRV